MSDNMKMLSLHDWYEYVKQFCVIGVNLLLNKHVGAVLYIRKEDLDYNELPSSRAPYIVGAIDSRMGTFSIQGKMAYCELAINSDSVEVWHVKIDDPPDEIQFMLWRNEEDFELVKNL